MRIRTRTHFLYYTYIRTIVLRLPAAVPTMADRAHLLEGLVNAVAGSAANAFSLTVFYPLETVR